MKEKICLILIVFFLISIKNTDAQICGISASKLNVPDAAVLPAGRFEFEPSFNVYYSYSTIGSDGKSEPIGGNSISSDLFFRITANIAEGLEIGAGFSRSLEKIDIGGKFIVYESTGFSVASVGGFSVPAGNKFIPTDQSLEMSESLGGIFSLRMNEKSSVDAAFSFTNYSGNEKIKNQLWGGLSYGMQILDKMQFIFELTGLFNSGKNNFSSKISSAAGISYLVNEGLIFVFGISNDLLGKNTETGAGYQAAFTMIL